MSWNMALFSTKLTNDNVTFSSRSNESKEKNLFRTLFAWTINQKFDRSFTRFRCILNFFRNEVV